ncbi:MAG: sensor histidine kinase [Chitinispirillaceae bacterium]
MNRQKAQNSGIPRKVEKVTEQLFNKQENAEKTERISEALQIFNDALNSSTSAIILIDLDGMITYTNNAYLRLFEVASDKNIIGRKISEVFSPDGKDQLFARNLTEYGGGFAQEVELRKENGSSFFAAITFSTINDSDGNRVGGMISFQNITARKQAEQEKEQLNRELEQKNRELEQIVYVASHDLRSPLVNIQGFSHELEHSTKELRKLLAGVDLPESARREVSIILEEDIQESLRFILSGVSKMDKLLAGLLRLSRLGRAALHREMLDMNKLITGIISAMEYQIKQAPATISVDDLPSCIGDEIQIGQVFANLVDNAIKYRQPHRPLHVKIRGICSGDECIYTVEDNGKGIDPAHQEKIFEIFHRLSPTAGSGEGLGLTIVRRILDKHRGKVRVESEPDKGSRFYVHLPRSG